LSSTGDPQAAVTVLGVDTATYPTLHDLTLTAGTGFGGPEEPVALISQQLASHDGYTVGSPISVLGAGGQQDLRVVGILAGSGGGGTSGSGCADLLAATVSAAAGVTAIVGGIDPSSALVSGAVGLAITILAAIEPAVRAARITPFEALRARFDLPSVRRARL